MKKFYVTFGQKYREEPHPTHGELIHPDGYVVVHTETQEEARRKTFEAFSDKWAFIYDDSTFEPSCFPKGVLFEIPQDTAEFDYKKEGFQPNPIFRDMGGSWYFFDETWSAALGPYRTKEQAVIALRRYCRGLDGGQP